MKKKCNLYFYLYLILQICSSIFSAGYSQNRDSDASFIFAQKLYNDQLYDLAAEQFMQFAEANFEQPKAPEALLMSGKCYLKIDKFKEAKKQFLSLIIKYPDAKLLDEAQYLLAESFEKNDDVLAAAKSYQQLQIFYPGSQFAVRAMLKSAYMFIRLEDYDSAANILYQLIELYPLDQKANEGRFLLAEVFVRKKDYKSAMLELDKLISLTENGVMNARSLVKKAQIEFILNHIQESEDILSNFLIKYRNSKSDDIINEVECSYGILGDIFHKKGQYQKSNEYLLKSATTKENIEHSFKIAMNYFLLADYSNAIEFFKKIINQETAPKYLIESYFQLGICYEKLKDYLNSNSAFDQVIDLCIMTRDSISKVYGKAAMITLSENHIKNKNTNIAVKYLKNYLKSFAGEKDNDVVAFRICALYHKEIGDAERAIRHYYDFLDEYPQSIFIDDAQFDLAHCFELKHDYKKAKIEYGHLILNYPASDYLEKAKQRLKYIEDYYQTQDEIIDNLSAIVNQLSQARLNKLSTFDIGLIYFQDLKNYPTAKNMFQKNYFDQSSDQNLKDDNIFYLAKSYQRLSAMDDIDNDLKQTYMDSAKILYQNILDNFPQSDFADDAAFHQIDLQFNIFSNIREISNPDLFQALLTDFRYKYPNSPHLNNINLLLGYFLLEKETISSVDSMDINRCCDSIISNNDKELADDAAFNLILLFNKIEKTSESEKRLRQFINEYAKSNKICIANALLAEIIEKKGDFEGAISYLKYIDENFFYSSCAEKSKLKIAELLQKQNKFSEAEIYYKKLLEQNASQISAQSDTSKANSVEFILYNLANSAWAKKTFNDALSYHREYLDRFPKGIHADEVLFKLANLQFINNPNEQDIPINHFRQLIKDFSASIFADSAYIKLAEIYFAREEYEMALNYYLDFMKKQDQNDSNLAYPMFRIITCLYRLDKINQADEQTKIFMKQFKDEKHLIANLFLDKGDYYIRAKDLKQAEKTFKDVKSNYSSSHDGAKAEYLLGKLNFIMNKDEDALDIMSRLIEKYPDDKILPDVYMTLGNFYYFQAKQIEHAMLSYKKAAEHKNIEKIKLQQAMTNLIKCYSDLGMKEQALTTTRSYLDKFPTAEDIFEKKILIGILYYELKEFDIALTMLKKLKYEVDLENEPRIQYWIGQCYFDKGEFKNAVSEYLKVAYLSKPTKLNWRVTAQYQAGIAYLKCGELQNAIQLFRKIITEQGADSVFGKPAKKRIEEINQMTANQ